MFQSLYIAADPKGSGWGGAAATAPPPRRHDRPDVAGRPRVSGRRGPASAGGQGREALRLPYSANAEAPDGTPVTLGFAQFDDNHFVVFNDPDAGFLWADFIKSIAREGGPGLLETD